jgi:dihydropteroate synthase
VATQAMIPLPLKLSSLTIMGVINITPDSFSDGGHYNDQSSFTKQLNYLVATGATVIDVGAQSTAPTSSPITAQEELGRYQQTLLPHLISYGWPDSIALSLDTFRPETFKRLYDEILEIVPSVQLIWNDVSGVMDGQLASLLTIEAPNCHYIFSHSGVTNREQSAHHLDFMVESSDMVKTVCEHFAAASRQFAKWGVEARRVIYDPCLGFSKSYEANWQLINGVELLAKSVAPNSLLMGLSRKSFLRERLIRELGLIDISREELIRLSDYLLCSLTSTWIQRVSPNTSLITRVHDPQTVRIAHIL